MVDFDILDSLTVGVIGDFALDIYWYADMTRSELSRETPHFPLPVTEERIYPGAAGNVAANIAALRPKRVAVCGVCGDDWRGALLLRELEGLGADVSGIFTEAGRVTNAYCKPMRRGISDVVYEDPRIDFSGLTSPSEAAVKSMLGWLDREKKNLDALCVCDQFANGAVTDKLIKRFASYGKPVVVDSRSRIGSYRGVTLKPNEVECRRALASLGLSAPEDDADCARSLARATGSRVLLTLGERGSVYTDGADAEAVPAVRYDGPTDICGAGDTFISAFACFSAAGASPAEAEELAALASSVTIRKLGVTGTASRGEIIKLMNEYNGGKRI